MIYAVSDLHGCYDKYIKLLERLNMTSDDFLYILGDIVDRGSDGIKIAVEFQISLWVSRSMKKYI